MDTLNRDQAPFPGDVWQMIDEAAASAARDQLTARRYLDLEGPFAMGLTGLLTIEGHQQVPGTDWAAPDHALQDVLAAATQLDNSGYRGPYALALAPALYNNLFRLFPGSDVMALEHLRRLCTAGIY